MPVDALRSVAPHIDMVLKHVHAKRIVSELSMADKGLFFRHFKGFRPEKIGRGRVARAVKKEILEGKGNVVFANMIILHWNQANANLYQDMVEHVQTINEDVEAIEQITDEQANPILDDLLSRYGQVDVLLCTRLNGVRFDESLIQQRLVPGGAAESTPSEESAPAAADQAAAGDDAKPAAG
ncbi:MAG: hypothetical protein CL940_00035 [Deltaproteobacteria bacterium]|nr:hypothetical protein [Deltaproteobacteria bacterium]